MQKNAPQNLLNLEETLEKAIDTVKLISDHQFSRPCTSLRSFYLQNGKLHKVNKSNLEKSLEYAKACFLHSFSKTYRQEASRKESEILTTFQDSLDLVKVYSTALSQMQKGSKKDQQIAKKILDTANQYNQFLREKKKKKRSIKEKFSSFIYRLFGSLELDDLFKTEIPVSETIELTKHKVTVQKQGRSLFDLRQKKPVNLSISIKDNERDLFTLKAIGLLLEQKESLNLSYKEAIDLIKENEITIEEVKGDFGYGMSQFFCYTSLSIFPGTFADISGSFLRDTFHPELAFPEPDSFQARITINQTGFPVASQATGFALSKAFLPPFLKKPHLAPNVSSLLEKRVLVARALQPNSIFFARAKKIYQIKKQLNHAHLLFDEMMHLFTLLSGQKQKSIKLPTNLSAEHEKLFEIVAEKPLEAFQSEWLVKKNSLLSTKTGCESFFNNALTKAIDELSTCYQKEFAYNLKQTITSIFLRQHKDHVLFEINEPTKEEKVLITLTFRQLLTFFYEIEALSEEKIRDTFFLQHIKTTIKEEIAIIQGLESTNSLTIQAKNLAEELFAYYCH